MGFDLNTFFKELKYILEHEEELKDMYIALKQYIEGQEQYARDCGLIC